LIDALKDLGWKANHVRKLRPLVTKV
jgi:hypothetical protein